MFGLTRLLGLGKPSHTQVTSTSSTQSSQAEITVPIKFLSRAESYLKQNGFVINDKTGQSCWYTAESNQEEVTFKLGSVSNTQLQSNKISQAIDHIQGLVVGDALDFDF